MKAKLSLLILSVLAGTCPAWAAIAPPPAPEAGPTPIGSPAEWIDPGAYPAAALRFEMAGTTAFRLAVDAAGKPVRCDIAESSGFDILDTATCERLLAKAKFSPPRNRTGGPAESVYIGRVRWVIPGDRLSAAPKSEHFGRVLLTFDPAGKLSSCRWALQGAAEAPCPKPMEMVPPDLVSEIRANAAGASIEAELQSAIAFTPDLRARVLTPRPGYKQLSLNVYRFTVTKEGTLGTCRYEEQRGIASMISDSCGNIASAKFDPPFSAIDKDGVATGWQIYRVLVKIPQ